MRVIYDEWNVKLSVEQPPPTPKYEVGQVVYREHSPDQVMKIRCREFEIDHEHTRAETCDREDGCSCTFYGEWYYGVDYIRVEHSTDYEESALCLERQGAEKYYVWLRMSYTPDQSVEMAAPLFQGVSMREIAGEYEAVHCCDAITRYDAMTHHYKQKWKME